MKRIFDFIFSTCILFVFLPFGIIISILIVLESRGGVFYCQKRIGQYGKEFHLIKFRTMKTGSDKSGELTIGMNDFRITKVGYFLRKHKLDEFPQFLNVFFGKMSVVGPRPEVKKYVDLYDDSQRKILNVKPGITDYASLEYFEENKLLGESENPEQTYIEKIIPSKIELNKKYLRDARFSTDLKIIFQTFLKMLKKGSS
jgi:lipopolysaccharide/colanic/teichoic acid biosynthesis glycosyltransferase